MSLQTRLSALITRIGNEFKAHDARIDAVEGQLTQTAWTPELQTQGVNFSSVTYTRQKGYYARVGGLVVGCLDIAGTVVTNGGANDESIITMPKKVNTSVGYADFRVDATIYIENLSNPADYLRILAGQAKARFGKAGSYDSLNSGTFPDGTNFDVYADFVYPGED